MKKLSIVFIVLSIVLLISSCSSPNNPGESLLVIESLQNEIKITNNSQETIYLFVVDQEAAALINWAPFFDEPLVYSGESIFFSYEEIYNGEGRPAAKGDVIIIYFWDGSDTDIERPIIHNKTITL
ncbi:MAG: hypothetical protein HND52_04840 [Ignavibacteriae bacterium]|nr:hypothetical protein [Ignavibacteriota bacterium]NOG97286.1 hypothetical protein [Ignavibacteriota bacterium]